MESSASGYIISANIKQQGRWLPWRLGHKGGGIRSEWKPPPSPLWSAYQSVPESRRRVGQLSPLHSLTHANSEHTGTLSLPPPLSVTLCSCVVFSDCMAYQRRSRVHDLSARQQKSQRKTMGWDGMAVLFCWCRDFQGSPSLPKGGKYRFCFLTNRPLTQRAWNKCPCPISYH